MRRKGRSPSRTGSGRYRSGHRRRLAPRLPTQAPRKGHPRACIEDPRGRNPQPGSHPRRSHHRHKRGSAGHNRSDHHSPLCSGRSLHRSSAQCRNRSLGIPPRTRCRRRCSEEDRMRRRRRIPPCTVQLSGRSNDHRRNRLRHTPTHTLEAPHRIPWLEESSVHPPDSRQRNVHRVRNDSPRDSPLQSIQPRTFRPLHKWYGEGCTPRRSRRPHRSGARQYSGLQYTPRAPSSRSPDYIPLPR